MSAESVFFDKVGEMQDEVRQLPNVVDARVIEETAVRLEALNYGPTTILPVNAFLRLKKEDLLEEIERILRMPADQVGELPHSDSRSYREIQFRYISVMVYYFKQLTELRGGNPQVWDEVDELYVHD